jgi:hypothetical protein
VDHPALASHYRHDRALLARICIQHQEFIFRRNAVELLWVGVLLFCVDCPFCPWVARDRRNYIVYGKFGCAFLQVLYHGHLLKGEVPQDDPQTYFKFPHLGHATLNLVAETLHVKHTVLIGITGELGQNLVRVQRDPKLLLQHVQQNEIDLKSAGCGKMVRVAALSLAQRDRQKQDRRLCCSASVGRWPRRHPKREEQSAEALFLQILQRASRNVS